MNEKFQTMLWAAGFSIDEIVAISQAVEKVDLNAIDGKRWVDVLVEMRNKYSEK